jgi:hypothetical protein
VQRQKTQRSFWHMLRSWLRPLFECIRQFGSFGEWLLHSDSSDDEFDAETSDENSSGVDGDKLGISESLEPEEAFVDAKIEPNIEELLDQWIEAQIERPGLVRWLYGISNAPKRAQELWAHPDSEQDNLRDITNREIGESSQGEILNVEERLEGNQSREARGRQQVTHRGKWYAVAIGRVPGIYRSCAEAHAMTVNFLGKLYQSFTMLAVAEDFMSISEHTRQGLGRL